MADTIQHTTHPLIDFLASSNSRITFEDRWMIVEKKANGEVYYEVFQKAYGKRKTVVLYTGFYILTALRYLESGQ